MPYYLMMSGALAECSACSERMPAGLVAVTDEIERPEGGMAPLCDRCLVTTEPRLAAALWGGRAVSICTALTE
ncbi:MAG: hypothetical protein GY719_14780 [bacterium]|nr:hypothetical protein [bacterium]